MPSREYKNLMRRFCRLLLQTPEASNFRIFGPHIYLFRCNFYWYIKHDNGHTYKQKKLPSYNRNTAWFNKPRGVLHIETIDPVMGLYQPYMT
ncbi:unnamed protein product [Linum tenue]|uniref:Uncharacterized protein n=1 Tax=Linum tenue TaxID=586396 RepID=A0AAV0NU17_9ROSI|nr:unnamed protein product [Linum tenue]